MLSKKILVFAVAAQFLLQPLVANADEQKPDDSAEKKAVITELLDISRVTKNAEIGFKSITDAQINGLNTMLSDRIDKDPKMTAEEKEKAKKTLIANMDKRMQRFRQLCEEKINIPQMTNEIYQTLYAKYFSVSELKDLVAFYKSPTGQRSLDVLPQLTMEAMQMIMSSMQPKIQEVGQQIEQEEKAEKH
jgi:hypothetical protein